MSHLISVWIYVNHEICEVHVSCLWDMSEAPFILAIFLAFCDCSAIKWVLNPIGEFIAQQSRELKNLFKITSINGAWGFYTLPLRCVWGFYTLPLRCVWGFYTLPLRCVWGFYTLPLRCVWGFYTLPLRCVWGFYKLPLRSAWDGAREVWRAWPPTAEPAPRTRTSDSVPRKSAADASWTPKRFTKINLKGSINITVYW